MDVKKENINVSYQKTEIGELIFASYKDEICILDFRYRKLREKLNQRIKDYLKCEFIECETKVIKLAKKQIKEYLENKRKEFEIPLLFIGSDFEKKVWKGLEKVKYGKTISYLELAKNINKVEAVRAVANANGKNSIGIILPCHRIISSNGELGGYGGGVSIKKKLLNLEKNKSLLEL